MKKLNTTIFDLDVIFTTMSHAETLQSINELKLVKCELLEIKDEYLDSLYDLDDVEELEFIDTQLIFINKNIRTLENALMCHESKISEKRTSLKDLSVFWLN